MRCKNWALPLWLLCSWPFSSISDPVSSGHRIFSPKDPISTESVHQSLWQSAHCVSLCAQDTFSFAAVGLPFDWHLLPISIDDQRANDHGETNNNRQQPAGAAYQEIAEETATDENTDGDTLHELNEPVTNRQSPFLQRQTRSFNFTDVLRRSQTFHFQREEPMTQPSTPWQDTFFAWIPNWLVQLLQQWMPKSESASQTVGSV